MPDNDLYGNPYQSSSRIHQLNQRRCVAADNVRLLGLMNTPIEYEARLKADAQYQLARDMLDRAEKEYYEALNAMTTRELEALGYPSITQDEEKPVNKG